MTQHTLETIAQLREDMTDHYGVAAIIRRYGRAGRWHAMLIFASYVDHSTHDTLAEATDLYQDTAAAWPA